MVARCWGGQRRPRVKKLGVVRALALILSVEKRLHLGASTKLTFRSSEETPWLKPLTLAPHMSTDTAPSTLVPTTREVGPLSDPSAWQVVLVDRGGQQVVLHNSARNEFSVRSSRWQGGATAAAGEGGEEEEEEELQVISQQPQSDDDDGQSARSSSPPPLSVCPLCRRPTAPPPSRDPRSRRLPLTKDSNYFTLLSEANSLANTPRTTGAGQQGGAGGKEQEEGEPTLDKTTLNTGYFATFFEEIQPLGRGGAGSVHLVRHVLNGEQLGLYACKKGGFGSLVSSAVRMLILLCRTVAVGDSSPSLFVALPFSALPR